MPFKIHYSPGTLQFVKIFTMSINERNEKRTEKNQDTNAFDSHFIAPFIANNNNKMGISLGTYKQIYR